MKITTGKFLMFGLLAFAQQLVFAGETCGCPGVKNLTVCSGLSAPGGTLHATEIKNDLSTLVCEYSSPLGVTPPITGKFSPSSPSDSWSTMGENLVCAGTACAVQVG